MTLFEYVTNISNSNLKYTREFEKIAQEIKSSALTGNKSIYILGGISEPVKNALRKQGFTIEYKDETGQRFGYIITW